MNNKFQIQWRLVMRAIFYCGLFLLLGFTFPLFLLFVPTPVIITRLEGSTTDAFLACLALFILILPVFGMLPALACVLFIFIVFVPVGEFLNDGAEDYLTITITTMGILLGVALLTASLYYFHDISVVEIIRSAFHEVFDFVQKEAPNMTEFIEDFKSMEEIIIDSLPSFIISTSLLTAFLNVFSAKNRAKNPKIMVQRREFSSYRISLKILGIIGIFVAGFYVLANAQIEYGKLLYLNAFSVFSNLLLFNGVTTGDFILKNLPKSVRILIPVLVIGFGFSIIYIGLGFLDGFINFRKRIPKIRGGKSQ